MAVNFVPSDDSSMNGAATVGVVVIGRNEGDRLKRCIGSVTSTDSLVVYVDSGSIDGSAEWASQHTASVVDLDMSKPFTAARARNAGFERLLKLAPELPLVQFVDGDCELHPEWLAVGQHFMNERADVAAVCGRLRERYPDRSIYNKLCDAEWQGVAGDSLSVGGNAMLRTSALSAVGGYRADLIAGEEPELCVRLRQAGWRVWRLSAEMALHDAAMTRFGQWWTRAVRSGHALAEGVALHGSSPEQHNVRELRRALLWGLALPIVIAVASLLQPASALLFLVYPLQILRLALRDGVREGSVWWQSLFSVLARFAEVRGAMKFWINRSLHRRAALFEYK